MALPDRVELREIRAVSDEEVDRLRRDQRLPVVLRCLEGLSHEEASRRLRWPLGTVKSRRARGRATSQGRLTRRGFAPSSALLSVAEPIGDGASLALPPPAPVEATARAVAGSHVAGEWTIGMAPAVVSCLVPEGLGSVLAFRLKVAAIGVLAAVASMAAAGLGSAHPGAQGPSTPSPTPPLPTKAPPRAPSGPVPSTRPPKRKSHPR